LLKQGEAAPAAACVRLAQSEQGSDPQFFPRNARVTVLSGSRPHVRIVSSEAVTEPMLEFRLMLGCDTIIARDFLLLADRSDALPASAPTPPATKRARSDISVETAPASPRRSILLPPAPIEGQRLLLPTATSLNLIARQLFPDNRERRDEYRRQIAKANPTLFSPSDTRRRCSSSRRHVLADADCGDNARRRTSCRPPDPSRNRVGQSGGCTRCAGDRRGHPSSRQTRSPRGGRRRRARNPLPTCNDSTSNLRRDRADRTHGRRPGAY
jgi:hypothetical protein